MADPVIRYVHPGLNECTDPQPTDWLHIVDVSATAGDEDRKVSLGKLALLALANTFAALTTFAQGIAIGVGGNTLSSINAGVVRQKIGWVVLQPDNYVVVSELSYASVRVFNASYGAIGWFDVEGGSSRLVSGNTASFSPTIAAGKICCLAQGGPVFVMNKIANPVTINVMVWE